MSRQFGIRNCTLLRAFYDVYFDPSYSSDYVKSLMLHDEVRYDFLMYILANFSEKYCKKYFRIGFNPALQCLYFPSFLLKKAMSLNESSSFSDFAKALSTGRIIKMQEVTDGAEYHHVSELIFSLYTGSNLFMFALLRFFFFFVDLIFCSN